ncbi:MAG: DUF4292 domain-containing protein [Runella sp.]
MKSKIVYIIHHTSYILLCIVIVLLSACHRPRQKNTPTIATDSLVVQKIDTLNSTKIDTLAQLPVEPEEIKVLEEVINFEYLTANSKISFKSKDQDIDNANVNIRMKKDSILWFSVVVGPIEVARGIMTQDSVQIVDRYNKAYYQFDYAALSRQFNFNLNFSMIQSILVGNMPIPRSTDQRFRRDRDYFLLRQEEGRVKIENYIGQQNRRLKKLLLTEQPTKNSLTLDYDDFTQLNSYLFPYTSLIELDYQSPKDQQRYQTVFRIKHQKVKLSETPLSFPFSIPPRYTKNK